MEGKMSTKTEKKRRALIPELENKILDIERRLDLLEALLEARVNFHLLLGSLPVASLPPRDGHTAPDAKA